MRLLRPLGEPVGALGPTRSLYSSIRKLNKLKYFGYGLVALGLILILPAVLLPLML